MSDAAPDGTQPDGTRLDAVRRLAVVSVHTSPLAQPGSGDGGGMNVYVHDLVSALAQSGVDCTVFTRRTSPDQPDLVTVEPGFDVAHVDAGSWHLAKEDLPDVLDTFTEAVAAHPAARAADAVHAHYWLSGEVGHRLKHHLDRPLVTSFHTLGLVKSMSGDPEPAQRIAHEHRIVACSDAVIANAEPERDQLVSLYGADPERVAIVAPGVDPAFFAPGRAAGARRAIGLDADTRVVLFVGRIQPLKGVDVAVRMLAALQDPDAALVVVGGPSGTGGQAYLDQVQMLARDLGVTDRIRWVPPQPHHLLSSFYRAADVAVVPSRSESFGLVALEAAACGVPVVATEVGGLTSAVRHGVTGLLVPSRDPHAFAASVDRLLADPALAARLGGAAADRAADFTWAAAAARVRSRVADLVAAGLVDCR